MRVKLLEAAARGLPVVGTAQAIGSIEAAIGMVPAADEDDFVDAMPRPTCSTSTPPPRRAPACTPRTPRRWSERIGQDAVIGWLSA